MRVMILSTAFSGMAQRLLCELKLLGHDIEQHYDLDEAVLRNQVESFNPEVILCPFLTQKIPEDIYRNYLCLIVHPGIEGDRGPSSLDWAIFDGAQNWGVTLIQADEIMDAGDIWGTKVFPLRSGAKTSIYKREVTHAAIELLKSALVALSSGCSSPRKLDYSRADVQGVERPLMTQENRKINWHSDTADCITRKINAADSRPGVKDILEGVEVYLYGAVKELDLRGAPGEIVAIQKGAICRATIDGAVWIKQLRCVESPALPLFKVPAALITQKILPEERLRVLGHSAHSAVIDDIKIKRVDDVAYFYFNFYNGAMNTQQCTEMKSRLVELKQSDVKMIVFMGGEEFFSNGIHLHCIEASDNPSLESWRNINAMNDLVFEMMYSPRQITISALRNNAGAGGAIMALASDEVIVRDGVVLNPHYKTMGLYGSEYWTFLLPNRVGPELSQKIVDQCEPMLAREALKIGLADLLFEEDWQAYHEHLTSYCKQLLKNVEFEDFLAVKHAELNKNIDSGELGRCRNAELAKMKRTFDDANSEYHRARQRFVNHIEPPRGARKDKKRPMRARLKELLFQRVS